MSKLPAWLAVVVGALLFVGQLIRNLGNLEYWATWGADVLAGGLLVAAGLAALRGAAPKHLASAWSFAAALYLSAFVNHAYRYLGVVGHPAPGEQKLVLIVGGLLAVSVAGAAMTLLGRRAGA